MDIEEFALGDSFIHRLDPRTKIVAALIVIAILDYVYQRWKHERDMRMSKEEVREEQKQHEGNPTVKGRIRAVQREMSLRRMMHDVPAADVVVRNPTHFAVALKYDKTTMAAPTAVAKGADLVAKRIIALAEDNDVAVVEDRPLARALYSTVEIGQQVPPELYRAVARILAQVYQLRGIAV